MSEKNDTASHTERRKTNFLIATLVFPFRPLIGILKLGFLFVLICALIGIPGIFLYIALDLFTGLVDLIFRLHIRQSMNEWLYGLFDLFIKPIVNYVIPQIELWSDQLGITAFLTQVGDALSNIATEVARGLILFVFFLLAGFAVYHLRIVHRVIYALLELGVAVIAMWIAIDGMAGGDFSLKYIIALLSGLYIMVRGLQNMDEGLKEVVGQQRHANLTDITGKAWLSLWEAVFYDPYEKSSFPSRSDRIAKASTIILSDFLKKRRSKRSAVIKSQNVQLPSESPELKSVPPPADAPFKSINERILDQSNTRIRDEVTKRLYKFTFNPESRMSKIVSFKINGEIGEGRNENEFKWRISDGRLEILNDRGEVYSRFLIFPDGQFHHTNDPDTRSIRGQYLEPIR